MTFRGLGVLVAILVSALPCASQVPDLGLQVAVTPLNAGGVSTATATGAAPASPWWIALDTDSGTRTLPGTDITINLALTPNFWVFPPQITDADGNGSLVVPVANDPTAVGVAVYIQALTVDPANLIVGADVSNLVHTGIHPSLVTGGQLTNLGNDDDQVYPYLMQAMSFTFYGVTYDTLHISTNGRISFNGGDPLTIENTAEFLGEEPSIGVLWDDLDPSSGGSLDIVEDTGGAWVRVTWTNVPQYGFSDASTAHCTLYADGSISLTYGTVTVQDGLIGITPGNNLSLAGGMDLSSLCWFAAPTGSAIYELFAAPTTFDCANRGLSFVPLVSGKYTILQ